MSIAKKFYRDSKPSFCPPFEHSFSCLHLFIARFTDSNEAVTMLKKAFIRYFYVGVSDQYSFLTADYDALDAFASVLLEDVGNQLHVFS